MELLPVLQRKGVHTKLPHSHLPGWAAGFGDVWCDHLVFAAAQQFPPSIQVGVLSASSWMHCVPLLVIPFALMFGVACSLGAFNSPYFLWDPSVCSFHSVPCAAFSRLVLCSLRMLEVIFSWERLGLWYLCSNSDAAGKESLHSFSSGMFWVLCHLRGMTDGILSLLSRFVLFHRGDCGVTGNLRLFLRRIFCGSWQSVGFRRMLAVGGMVQCVQLWGAAALALPQPRQEGVGTSTSSVPTPLLNLLPLKHTTKRFQSHAAVCHHWYFNPPLAMLMYFHFVFLMIWIIPLTVQELGPSEEKLSTAALKCKWSWTYTVNNQV